MLCGLLWKGLDMGTQQTQGFQTYYCCAKNCSQSSG